MEKVNLKIMLVDDDKFLLDMYATKFTNAGYEVETISNSEEALTKIQGGFSPDVLLLDLIMPKMNGLELLEVLKNKNLIPNTLKVVLTNQGQQTDVEKAREIGIDGYIVKALHTPSEVLKVVEDLYSNKKTS